MKSQFAFCLGLVLLLGGIWPNWGQPSADPLVRRPWYEARSLHFHTYSCGPTQEVAKLAARLEQFREAYAVLAGAQAVASPPVVVMAFPDHDALKPFLPLYQGQPANLTAFFSRGSDENLIAVSLTGANSNGLASIFHEYAHLLFRHNERIWPMWLKEGMAEVYSTFEVAGEHSVRIGQPIPSHLRRLAEEPLRPLAELLAVTHASPQYNERQHQGIFYAESWLLTHYLMLSDQAARQGRFGQLTFLLQQGQSSEQAFTNAFHISLTGMLEELHRYLERGKFRSLELAVNANLRAPQALATRVLGPAETCFRLGDQLLRVGRLDDAGAFFTEAQRLGPASPLGAEGLGLLASERRQPALALQHLHGALRQGSRSFLAHYIYAREKFRLLATAPEHDSRLDQAAAGEIRAELKLSLSLMPDFGPAHHLLGCLELIQGEDLGAATRQLQKAIQLEPENQSYLLSLAQAQLAGKNAEAARHTLEALRRPWVEASLRQSAEELLQTLSHR